MTEFITKLKMFCGLQNVFIKALEYCNDPHEYSKLVGEWNKELEKINKTQAENYEDSGETETVSGVVSLVLNKDGE